MSENFTPAWENLVTEGHARAARFRWLQPWLVGLGALLVLTGLHFQAQIKPAATTDGYEEQSQAVVAEMTGRARDTALRFVPPQIPSDQLTAILVNVADVPNFVQATTQKLAIDGKLPQPAADAALEIGSEQFWRKPWPVGSLVMTTGDGVKLLGMMTNRGTKEVPIAAAVIVIFRKRDDHWEAAALTGPNLFAPPGVATVAADQIPLTLQSVLPEAP